MICTQFILSRGLLGSILAGALLATTGCDSGPKLHPVTGKVLNKGAGNVKDLASYIIQFQSTTDPNDLPGGTVKEDGSFTICSRVNGKEVAGVKEGTYHARLIFVPVEGAAPPLLIAPRYTKFDTANLTFTVAPGPNDLTIEVDRIGR